METWVGRLGDPRQVAFATFLALVPTCGMSALSAVCWLVESWLLFALTATFAAVFGGLAIRTLAAHLGPSVLQFRANELSLRRGLFGKPVQFVLEHGAQLHVQQPSGASFPTGSWDVLLQSASGVQRIAGELTEADALGLAWRIAGCLSTARVMPVRLEEADPTAEEDEAHALHGHTRTASDDSASRG